MGDGKVGDFGLLLNENQNQGQDSDIWDECEGGEGDTMATPTVGSLTLDFPENPKPPPAHVSRAKEPRQV